MKFLLMKLIFFMSTMSCFVLNPLSMGLLLIFYSLVVSVYIGKVMLTSWFCIIIMLMMIGGLLVIFMYISSISSNEKFKVNILILSFFLVTMMLFMEEFMFEYHTFDSIHMLNDLNLNESFFMVKLYNNSCMMLTVFMVIYLIFTMVVVSNIVKHYKGPLRSLSYE